MAAVIRCVLVDDDADFISLLRVWIWRLRPELEIITFSTALDAVDYLVQNRAGLVISDCIMPMMTGWALVEAVRASRLVKKVPVILVSEDEMEAQAMASGATAFYPKRELVSKLPLILTYLDLPQPARSLHAEFGRAV